MVTSGRFDEPRYEDLTARLLGTEPSPQGGADNSRLADEWLGRRLKEVDYDLEHPVCQQFADHLCALGIGTLINLKKTNKLFPKCVELGMRGLPHPPESWNAESDWIITVAVRASTPRFITDSMPLWDSTQSAITTYFVNYCLFRFKTVYLQYWRSERQVVHEVPTDNVVDLFEAKTALGGVEDLVIARQTIREALLLMDDDRFATIVQLAATGSSRAEIAAVLEISVSTLDRRMAQYRKKLKNGGWPGGKVGRS